MRITIRRLKRLIRESVDASRVDDITLAMAELKAAYHQERQGQDGTEHIQKADAFIHRLVGR